MVQIANYILKKNACSIVSHNNFASSLATDRQGRGGAATGAIYPGLHLGPDGAPAALSNETIEIL